MGFNWECKYSNIIVLKLWLIIENRLKWDKVGSVQ
jgi:hypothetical protein